MWHQQQRVLLLAEKDGSTSEQPAEIKKESDGETEKEERLYDDTVQYLIASTLYNTGFPD